mmetsp:Transcript_98969/g.206280  ORF Transcript_98969/g.206280 Transcript_98969/m.206280 type:complete len:269 (+) Transcript_98969:435-1241(+)
MRRRRRSPPRKRAKSRRKTKRRKKPKTTRSQTKTKLKTRRRMSKRRTVKRRMVRRRRKTAKERAKSPRLRSLIQLLPRSRGTSVPLVVWASRCSCCLLGRLSFPRASSPGLSSKSLPGNPKARSPSRMGWKSNNWVAETTIGLRLWKDGLRSRCPSAEKCYKPWSSNLSGVLWTPQSSLESRSWRSKKSTALSTWTSAKAATGPSKTTTTWRDARAALLCSQVLNRHEAAPCSGSCSAKRSRRLSLWASCQHTKSRMATTSIRQASAA